MVCLCAAASALAASGGEARTPAEWLRIVRDETARQKRTEPADRRRLLLTAAAALHPHRGGPWTLAERKGPARTPYEPFLTWLDREGAALCARWSRGEPLPSDRQALRPILEGMRLYRYRQVRRKVRQQAALTDEERGSLAFGRRVERRGREVLRRGYLGARLTAAEIDDLRRYALWVDIRHTGGGVLPFHLELTERWKTKHPPLGRPAPDCRLLRMEAALASPRYSDVNPRDPTDVLRPAILWEYLLLMEGYERDPSAAPGRPRVRARPVEFPGAKPGDDIVRLSAFRGRKPVLLVLANPTDLWAWHWRIAPMFEPLHQACKGRVDFFLVHTTIHDTYMPVKDFLGPAPGRHEAVHDLTVEQRARACKMFHMDLPHATIPYLLDDMSQRTRNAYRDQGGGAYVVLVDLDGRVAYADYHQDIPPHWGPRAVSFHDEYVYIRMNHLESRLASFLAGGCRYDKRIETPYPTWRRPPVLTGAKVERVDPAGRTLYVAPAGKAAGPPRAIRLTPAARVTVDHAPAALKDLKPGETVNVSFAPAGGEGSGPAGRATRRARHVQALRNGEAARKAAPTIWMSAVLREVDAAARRLRVERITPPAREMKGLHFWQQAGPDARPYDADARARLAVVRKWLADPREHPTYELVMDDAADVFLNGRAAGLADLRAGDRLGVAYRTCQEARPPLRPLQVRAYRFGK